MLSSDSPLASWEVARLLSELVWLSIKILSRSSQDLQQNTISRIALATGSREPWANAGRLISLRDWCRPTYPNRGLTLWRRVVSVMFLASLERASPLFAAHILIEILRD